jgi:hypothetical protein
MLEQDVSAKLGELDLVVADLTRANERVATVERRNVSSGHYRLRIVSTSLIPNRNSCGPKSSRSEADLNRLNGAS